MNKFINSFRVAFRGIMLASSGRNFRVEVSVALAAIAGVIGTQISSFEWQVVPILIALVLSLEIMNSAVEQLVDHVSGEQSSEARTVKDMAAGAVLWASIVSAAAGMVIFIPRISQRLTGTHGLVD